MKKLFFGLLLLLPGSAFADAGLANEDEVLALADQFMQLIAKDEIEPAIELLAPHFQATDMQRTALANQLQQARLLLQQQHGGATRHVLASSEGVADALVRHSYLELGERRFTRWMLTFYKPGDRWLFYTVAWDDNVAALLR